jgi:hypothetical protein
VDAQKIALIPECVECEARWLPADPERWQAWLTDDDPPELAFFCPECAERELQPYVDRVAPERTKFSSFGDTDSLRLLVNVFKPSILCRPRVNLAAMRTFDRLIAEIADLEGGSIDHHSGRHALP